ncbi:MAG: hypothetical protein R2708_20570 [Vicinamibacterales bacterium]
MRVFAAACVMALLAMTGAAQVRGVESVRGAVVDLASVRAPGPFPGLDAHGATAMARARDGQPMAIVGADAVWIVEGSYTDNGNAKLLDFVGKYVEAKGTLSERDGRRYINVAAMMVDKPGQH